MLETDHGSSPLSMQTITDAINPNRLIFVAIGPGELAQPTVNTITRLSTLLTQGLQFTVNSQ